MSIDTDITPRLGLPMLASGQAQKELTHNEALLLIDMVVAPVVESVGTSQPPAGPSPGQCWIVGDNPVGAWAGAANHLVIWTTGGWRSMALPDHAEVRERTSGIAWTRTAQAWVRAPGWMHPADGDIVDSQARAALQSLAAILADHGLLLMA